MDAAGARQGQDFPPRYARPYDVLRAVVVAFSAALEQIDFGRFEEVPIYPSPKCPVLLRDVEQTTLHFTPHCLKVPTQGVDGQAEGMSIWERDESDGPCPMSHTLPPCKVKVGGGEGSEIPLDLPRFHFQIGRKRSCYDRRRGELSNIRPAAAFNTSCDAAPEEADASGWP